MMTSTTVMAQPSTLMIVVGVTMVTRPKRDVVDMRSYRPFGLERVTPRKGGQHDQDRYDGRPQQHDPIYLRFLSMGRADGPHHYDGYHTNTKVRALANRSSETEQF